MVEPIEFTTEPLQEPFASRDAAVSCLARLSVRNDGAMRSEAARANIDLAGETLPLSGLVTLAAEFGLKAERVRLDWQGLKTAVSVRSVLIVRNNSEVVVVTGGGRSGAEEVSVWDPHHDGVVFFVSREDFERTWSGHALLIASKDAGANIFDISPTPSGRSKQQRAPRKPQVSLGLSLGVAATALVTSLGMVLFLLTPPDATGDPKRSRTPSPGGRDHPCRDDLGSCIDFCAAYFDRSSSGAQARHEFAAWRTQTGSAPGNTIASVKTDHRPGCQTLRGLPGKVFALSPAW